MTTDPSVSAAAILRAESALRRLGRNRIIEQIEREQPELSSFLLEALANVHRRLGQGRYSQDRIQRLHRYIEQITLVIILSMHDVERPSRLPADLSDN